MKITAHIIVKNEARFVWFAVMSVIDYVDKVLLWDTGSSDGTIEILREIKKLESGKVDLREVGPVTAEEFTRVRQEMLDATKTDWFLLIDGDEVWWEESIKKVIKVIRDKGKEIESIVVPTINLVGDIYHYQEEKAGRYKLAGRMGHLNLRGVNRKIPGLRSSGPHGVWGWVDEQGKMIQERDPQRIKFVDAPYLHATFLARSVVREADIAVPKRAQKLKYELGIPFANDFYYPEVFFRKRPEIVPSPWERRRVSYTMRAALETPFKKLKRRILPGNVGY